MATYLTLYRYTDEGMKKIKNAPEVAKEWEQQAKEVGVTLKALYWLQGEYDAMTVVECENEDAVNALLFSIGAQGYLRTQTMRAFSADTIRMAR